MNSIDFTKIGHHLFLHSKSAPGVIDVFSKYAWVKPLSDK